MTPVPRLPETESRQETESGTEDPVPAATALTSVPVPAAVTEDAPAPTVEVADESAAVPAARPVRSSRPAAARIAKSDRLVAADLHRTLSRRAQRITGRQTKIAIPLPVTLAKRLNDYERRLLSVHHVSLVRKRLASECIEVWAARPRDLRPWLYSLEAVESAIGHMSAEVTWDLNLAVKTAKLDLQDEFPGISQRAVAAAILNWYLTVAELAEEQVDAAPPMTRAGVGQDSGNADETVELSS